MFPYMVCSQFMSYVFEDAGLYIGIHDPARSVKGIDFRCDECGTTMQIRLFCGADFGEEYTMDYPIVWAATDEKWESTAEIYRQWFETALPPRLKKISENNALPSWYKDEPLIVSYPVRGIHDMDEMKPNKLFPYTNALPLINEVKDATGAKIMALLSTSMRVSD